MVSLPSDRTDTAYFAGGCFWCTEAVFSRIAGVTEVKPGYAGGDMPNPTYRDVCTGITGHTETIRIVFDPATVSYEALLDVFWHTHDPTTLNRQGADEGTQYRSAVFYTGQRQKDIAESTRNRLNQEEFGGSIVTEISPLETFYPAEAYHNDYYSRNKSQPYCQYIISPKIDKLNKRYKNLVRQ